MVAATAPDQALPPPSITVAPSAFYRRPSGNAPVLQQHGLVIARGAWCCRSPVRGNDDRLCVVTKPALGERRQQTLPLTTRQPKLRIEAC
jgi:hypothetical protein